MDCMKPALFLLQAFACANAESSMKFDCSLHGNPRGFVWTTEGGGVFVKCDHLKAECCGYGQVGATVPQNSICENEYVVANDNSVVVCVPERRVPDGRSTTVLKATRFETKEAYEKVKQTYVAKGIRKNSDTRCCWI